MYSAACTPAPLLKGAPHGIDGVCSGGASLVAMVQSADFRERDHLTFHRGLHASWRGRVFLQREMRSRPMIIGDISGAHAPQMRLVDDDHVIETFASDRSDQSFNVRIGVIRRVHRLRAMRDKRSE